jgi:hypothetical protein
MPSFICHHNNRFFMWSTITDAPTTGAMTLPEFEDWYRVRFGSEGMNTLPDRIARAVKNGTSSHEGESLRDMIRGNRAGPREGCLSFKKIIELVNSETRTEGDQL